MEKEELIQELDISLRGLTLDSMATSTANMIEMGKPQLRIPAELNLSLSYLLYRLDRLPRVRSMCYTLRSDQLGNNIEEIAIVYMQCECCSRCAKVEFSNLNTSRFPIKLCIRLLNESTTCSEDSHHSSVILAKVYTMVEEIVESITPKLSS